MIQILAQGGAASGAASEMLRGDSLILVVVGAIAITGILASALKHIVTSAAREKTRREIAAYIAEGSMSPEQGEKLMNAGEGKPRA
jgi:hypothetical protein